MPAALPPPGDPADPLLGPNWALAVARLRAEQPVLVDVLDLCAGVIEALRVHPWHPAAAVAAVRTLVGPDLARVLPPPEHCVFMALLSRRGTAALAAASPPTPG